MLAVLIATTNDNVLPCTRNVSLWPTSCLSLQSSTIWTRKSRKDTSSCKSRHEKVHPSRPKPPCHSVLEMVVWGGIYKKSLRPYDIAVRADRCCCYAHFTVCRWNREFMMTIVDQSRSRIRGKIKVEIFLVRRI